MGYMQMDPVTMSGLLKADEEKIRNELKADAAFDKNRKQSAVRLDDAFSKMLLRYNAACTTARPPRCVICWRCSQPARHRRRSPSGVSAPAVSLPC